MQNTPIGPNEKPNTSASPADVLRILERVRNCNSSPRNVGLDMVLIGSAEPEIEDIESSYPSQAVDG